MNGESDDHDVRREDRVTASTRRAPLRATPVELLVERERGAPVSRRWSSAEATRVRIGALDGCDLVIDDPSVSGIHCELRVRDGAWRLTDLGSTNGTWLDGIRLRDVDLPARPVRLVMGDSTVCVSVARPDEEPITTGPVAFGRLYGASAPMQRLYAKIARVAPTERDVLIEGESGTGKELVTAELVARSARAKAPLVIVDCGTIPPNLAESELFGHVRGAFTGAERDRIGVFEQASGGTVFLDEIGELPAQLQPKLLRILAARELRRVGELTPRAVDVRVIAATNRRLEVEVNQGRFRQDLFFRLSVIRLELPPLRERFDDLPLLVGAALEELGAPQLLERFTPALYDELRSHAWPGNVRELRNWLERFIVLEDKSIGADRKPPEAITIDPQLSYTESKALLLAEFERRFAQTMLQAANGNVSKAARLARMDRMHFYKLLQRHDLRRGSGIDD